MSSEDAQFEDGALATAAADRLLAQRDGVANWPAYSVSNGINGWVKPVPECSWTGITCDPFNGTVVNFKWGCWVNEQVAGALQLDGLCGTRAQGTLAAALGGIKTMQTLDFTNQSFSGRYLQWNNLSGPLPLLWGNPNGFPALTGMELSHNRLNGTVPPIWASGLQSLETLYLFSNQLTGDHASPSSQPTSN
ncbi:hypothetical protein CHLNCDRAFT_141533 [Chlorella variabilis]|uniref:Leucine-rich repeat-containing N-terminal plant-type domain-containing protein n=1 Tax=Chlorella variabilis TaxID=554065 RepID=E1ZT22_CHLVA|nr:hypothetical protein CHLNCDRAFT_141533 [Chlorella variabilis]EFN51004.1 hypothetical protein CHLNCDRAFT_141533 [Chlorella variabilis]|eukprot:XP_005843106.1 hypothetical protein CHLNCDRAFT_141533 [Chlorella variabilis]